MNGWIKLHRKIKDHWIFDKPNYFRAWVIILMEVNHKERKTAIGATLFTVKEGESINSLDTWASLFGPKWSKQKVRTFFSLLKDDGIINTQNERKTTRLSVCNWGTYQLEQHANNTQITCEQHANNTQITPNKNVKNVKNDNNDKKVAEGIYQLYPRKIGKSNAIKAITKALKVVSEEYLTEAVIEYSKATNGKDKQFIPHPATWFNQERWEDDRSEWNNRNQSDEPEIGHRFAGGMSL